MTDSELRALIRANPAQGHRALYDTYANYAYAIIARYLADCGSREDIEDCLVETFTEVMLHIGTITGDSIKAYIGASARNRALNYCTSLRRQRLHTVPMEDTAEPSVQHVQEQAEARAMQAQLLQENARDRRNGRTKAEYGTGTLRQSLEAAAETAEGLEVRQCGTRTSNSFCGMRMTGTSRRSARTIPA